MTEEQVEQKVYESPAIVYEGKITSRAGSPLSVPGDDDSLGLFDNS